MEILVQNTETTILRLVALNVAGFHLNGFRISMWKYTPVADEYPNEFVVCVVCKKSEFSHLVYKILSYM